LFLDEIGTLSAPAQSKVLLAIDEGRIRRLGSSRELAVDTRVIVASNRPLADLVARGVFREDLFHRLNLLCLTLPPLRERGTDLLEIARCLLRRIATRHRLGALRLSPEAETQLLAQRWPGNVRELAHELERAVIFGAPEKDGALDLAHLGPAAPAAPGLWRNPAWRLPESGFSLDAVVAELIAEALRETGNNVSAAARRLGVTREFLRYRLGGGESDKPPG
jgi:DNA-binding NtrC family response regulator